MRPKALIFGCSILAAGLLALAVAENLRPWRRLQAEFLDLERQQLQERLAATRARSASETEALRAAVAAETERLAGQRAEVERVEGELRDFRGKLRKAERRRRAVRFELEEARYRSRQDRETAAENRQLEAELFESRIEIEGLREFVDNRERRLAELRSGLVEAEHAWERLEAPARSLEERQAELERGAWLRGVPVLELFQPGVAVREVSLPESSGAGPRVDRCATCHLGATREGFDGAEEPALFRSHPRLELFVGEDSPHPYSRFGCASCHGGEARSVDFDRAGHRSGVRPGEAAGRPILPLPLVESSCVRCHGSDPRAGGGAAEAGRRLISSSGCAGCHPAVRATGGPPAVALPKAGPSLAGLATKTRPAWAFRWLAAPRAFRPTTSMPHFFDLEIGDSRRREQRDAEILAIVRYLWEHSRTEPYPGPPAGDRAAGRSLFESVGCAACHLLDPDARRGDFYPRFERLQGPNLARTGNKVDAGWLYAWLRAPDHYRPDTPMPSLRLSAREAADLTAYLMDRNDPAWAGGELPAMPRDARDDLVLTELRESLTVAASDARLEEMSERERTLFLGERSILRHRCQGCHDVPGFEDAPAPGSGEIVDLGRKVAFSRIGDSPDDPFHLAGSRGAPRYAWNRREAEAILVDLLGRSQASESAAPIAEKPELSAGRAILERYGCRSCHSFQAPGLERSSSDGSSDAAAPPDLSAEGAKVRPAWLFSYLRDPGRVAVRPWLAVRMPTFHWSDTAIEAVVLYFVERGGGRFFEGDPPAPRRRDLEVGRAVFRMLQCDRCHPDVASSNRYLPAPAPAYTLASERLRPGWVVGWVLDPRRWDPGTAMPSHFVADGKVLTDASYLVANLSMPMFREHRDRLERAFGSEEELEAYFSDSTRVAAALRDYLWALDE